MPPLDPADLILSLEALKARPPTLLLALQREIAANVMADIVIRTPVDTGFCRANWWPSVDAPSAAILPPFNAEAGKDGTVSGEAAAGMSLSRLPGALGEMKPFGVFYINNNVEYAGALELGHSKQAPAGMVRPALAYAKALYHL